MLSVAPSNAATDSLKSDLSEVPAAPGNTGIAAIVNHLLPRPGDKRKKKSVAFAEDVADAAPSPQRLTEEDLAVHNLMYRHSDDPVARLFRLSGGVDPNPGSWEMPPNDMSSVKSQCASTRSRYTQDSTSSYILVPMPSEQDDTIAAAGFWADVSVTYHAEIDLSNDLS